MTKIEEFLTYFDDQHLANLQCAAEDGRLVYRDGCNCLVHHFAGEYSATKWDPEIGPLARAAEGEFFKMGSDSGPFLPGVTLLAETAEGDPRRRAAILPLIHGEWAQRLRKELGNQLNKIEELTEPSPVVR